MTEQTESFGQRLRRLRKAAGLTQRDLAGDGVDPSYVSLLEKDLRSPTPDTVETLARGLGCSPHVLATGEPEPDESVLLASAELGIGHADKAIQRLAPHMPRIATSISNTADFATAETYATALERTGDLEDAIAWLERLRSTAMSEPGKFPLCRVSMALVRCYRAAGELLSAAQVGEQAVAAYRELGLEPTDEYGALLVTIASAYAESGDFVHASTLLNEAAEAGERMGDMRVQAYAYWNAAIAASDRGRYAEGHRLISKASVLLECTDDLRARARIRAAQAWMLLQQSPPDPATARSMLRDELPRLRQQDGTMAVATAETDLARCELLLGRPNVARRLAASSMRRLPDTHRVEKARAGAVHGAALVAIGEREAGLREVEEAVQLLLDSGAQRQAATTLRELGSIYESIGDLPAALDCSQRALTLLGITSTVSVAPATQRQTSKRRVRA